jgi:hypothetical protein
MPKQKTDAVKLKLAEYARKRKSYINMLWCCQGGEVLGGGVGLV